MGEPWVLALDLGTTGVKAAAVRRSGAIAASAYRDYPTAAAGPAIEQDPRDWERAALEAVREVTDNVGAEPAALALTGQMQDLVLEGREDSPAILYSDTRARAEAEEVAAAYGLARIVRESGNAHDATGLAAKLLWVSRNAKPCYNGAERLLFGAHDHLAFKLCGRAVTDLTTASTTGLLRIAEGAWNLGLLESVGLRTDLLPELAPADAIVGGLTAEAARLTDLPEGLPVIHGSGDAGATTLGSGAGEPGTVSINLGTSGWVAVTRRRDGPLDRADGVFNLRHPDGESLISIGAPATAAGNYDWLRQALLPGESAAEAFSRLDSEARAARPGRLIYLPYLAGERSPFADADARAAFVGIGRETGRGDLARAVLEGVAFSLRSVIGAMGETVGGPRPGRPGPAPLVGGGARSTLWCLILASALGREIRVPESPGDAGVRGAAMLAARALGWQRGFAASEGYLPISARYAPEPAWAAVYGALFPAYEGLHEALRGACAAIAASSPGRT